MAPLLEVKEVTKLYKHGRGIRNISFEIAKGDIFGLVGPNGAGKTTLLKVITGLIYPEQGDVRLFGHSVSDQFELAMQKVGCMVETADAYGYMSAFDNLKLAARFYPELPKTRIDEVLDQVGLTPYKKEKVRGFSLGMKQRLGLASVLLSNPELIILDEPTNGLDIEGIVDFRKMVQRLAYEQGMTFLISSHMIHELSMNINRIGIIKNGQLIQVGKVAELTGPGMTLEQYVVSQIQTTRRAINDEPFNRQSVE